MSFSSLDDKSWTKPSKLGPGHGISKRRLDSNFLSALNESAQRAAATQKEIAQKRTVDAFLLTDLASDLREEPQVCQGNEGHHAAHQTIISNCFGGLAERVARSAVSREAEWNIIEAAAEAITPFLRHLGSCVLERYFDCSAFEVTYTSVQRTEQDESIKILKHSPFSQKSHGIICRDVIGPVEITQVAPCVLLLVVYLASDANYSPSRKKIKRIIHVS